MGWKYLYYHLFRRCAIKSILWSLTITLAVALSALAQNDDNDGGGGPDSPDCKQCWSVQGAVCNAGTPCIFAAPSSVTFTAPCDTTYKFQCKTHSCTAGTCWNCITCSRLIDVATGNIIATCTTVLDAQGFCERSCEDVGVVPGGGSLTLVANQVYRLEVEKFRCPALSFCNQCNCKCEARVFLPGAACPSW